jgi:hypothetical protein
LVTPYAGTAFYNSLLKERQKGQENEEEDVHNYWMTLRKQEDTES